MNPSLLFAALASVSAFAAAQQPASAPIERQMTPEQFKAAGLDKLSPAELKRLNDWISGVKTVVVEKVVEKTIEIEKPRESTEEIQSRLVGEFKGWRGNTAFTLENGQIWQQADNAELYAKRLENPKVRVKYSSLSGWSLQVEGYGSWVKVKRVK